MTNTTVEAESREHDLKTWPVYFRLVKSGAKRFEVRRDDRDFRAGDTLRLREWDPAAGAYTGDVVRVRVTYVLGGGQFGVEPGNVVMSIDAPSPATGGETVLVAAIKLFLRDHDAATEALIKDGAPKNFRDDSPGTAALRGALAAAPPLAAVVSSAPTGEPEAWRGRLSQKYPWHHTGDAMQADAWVQSGFIVERLYASPPAIAGPTLDQINAAFDAQITDDDERYGHLVNGVVRDCRSALLALFNGAGR